MGESPSDPRSFNIRNASAIIGLVPVWEIKSDSGNVLICTQNLRLAIGSRPFEDLVQNHVLSSYGLIYKITIRLHHGMYPSTGTEDHASGHKSLHILSSKCVRIYIKSLMWSIMNEFSRPHRFPVPCVPTSPVPRASRPHRFPVRPDLTGSPCVPTSPVPRASRPHRFPVRPDLTGSPCVPTSPVPRAS